MNLSFIAQCTLVVVSALAVSVILAPYLWDAAGYVETILNNPIWENLR